jgi:hypothetical protein
LIFNSCPDESGTDVIVKVADMNGEHAAFNTNGNIISADKMTMDHSSVDILMKQLQDTTVHFISIDTVPGFVPDFGVGLGFKIKELVITDCHFASHQDTILITPKFDPAHLSFDNIQIHLADLKMNPDTLEGSLHELQAKLPGFQVERSAVKLQMTRQQLSIADLQLYSGADEITGNVNASYVPASNAPGPNALFSVHSNFLPAHFEYFLPDDILKQIKSWSTTRLIVKGQYLEGKTNLDTLTVTTSNSQLHVFGQLHDVTDLKNISWQNLSLQSSVGEDFKRLLAPYLGDVQVPPFVQVQMISTGSQAKIFMDGNVQTSWGNAIAKGTMALTGDDIDLDMKVSGQNLYLSHWIEQDWLGALNATAAVKGKLGKHQDAQINGQIASVELLDKNIRDITFQSHVQNENISATYQIQDSRYRMKGQSNIAFGHSMLITNQLELDSFHLGEWMELDSSFELTGNLAADITLDADTIKGNAISNHLFFKNQYADYSLDTLSLTAMLSPSGSQLEYLTDEGRGSLTANFDIQEASTWLEPWIKNVLYPDSRSGLTNGDRSLAFDFHFTNPAPLHLVGIDVEDFTTMDAKGTLQEKNHVADLQFLSGRFKGYGVAYDTLHVNLAISGDSLGGKVNGNHIFYKTFDVGNLDFVMKTRRDSTLTDLTLSRDSATYVDLSTRILRNNSGTFIYPSRLKVFDNNYNLIRITVFG